MTFSAKQASRYDRIGRESGASVLKNVALARMLFSFAGLLCFAARLCAVDAAALVSDTGANGGGNAYAGTSGTAESGRGGTSAGFPFGGVFADGVYTRADTRSLVVSGKGALLVEDYDALFRPVARTEWRENEKTASVAWVYPGDGLYPYIKNETFADGSVRTVFDAHGRETERSRFDGEGRAIQNVFTDYLHEDGDVVLSVVTERFSPESGSLSTEKVVFTYDDGGSVSTEEHFADGSLVRVIQYSGVADWTETVYYDGAAVFTGRYVDGVRVTGR